MLGPVDEVCEAYEHLKEIIKISNLNLGSIRVQCVSLNVVRDTRKAHSHGFCLLDAFVP